MNITKELILDLSVEDVRSQIQSGGLIDIAKHLGAFWTYDYMGAEEGRLGLHAKLKSGLHSDGFFVSKILLESENIRRAVAHEMVKRLKEVGVSRPDFVVGIPDGATKLGALVAEFLGSQKAEMVKEGGHITLHTPIPSGASVLLVEDFCTRGTGFTEAVEEIKLHCPWVNVLPFYPVIINRGGLAQVDVEGAGHFKVIAIVDNRIQDWEPDKCPLCESGSGVIKPKVNDHNWKLITTSQLP